MLPLIQEKLQQYDEDQNKIQGAIVQLRRKSKQMANEMESMLKTYQQEFQKSSDQKKVVYDLLISQTYAIQQTFLQYNFDEKFNRLDAQIQENQKQNEDFKNRLQKSPLILDQFFTDQKEILNRYLIFHEKFLVRYNYIYNVLKQTQEKIDQLNEKHRSQDEFDNEIKKMCLKEIDPILEQIQELLS